jgi:dienelactone hydrolase
LGGRAFQRALSPILYFNRLMIFASESGAQMKFQWTFPIVALILNTFSIATGQESPEYADHTKLLVLKDATGAAKSITDKDGWLKKRAHIIANFEKVAGPMPGADRLVPLDVKRDLVKNEGSYTRYHVTYAVEKGDRATAWLLVPNDIKPGEKRAGVVAIHQTTKIGKDEPANVGGLANLHYGQELAQRGHVVICPDYHRYGERMVDPYKLGWQSATMKGIWDHMRAVDLLTSLPEVDATKIAAIGHSLGGHNSIFLALYDMRVKAVVSSCGYNSFPYYYGGKIAGWSHEGYMPLLKSKYNLDLKKVPFDWPELVGAIAPRALFTNAPTSDSNFETEGVRVCQRSAEPVYQLLGVPEKLVYVYPDAAHDFPPVERQKAYAFIEKNL